jgi:asparagine synthetase B (glutamine-hydrolysing)
VTAFCGVVNLDGAPVDPALLQTMMQPLTSGGRAEIRFFLEGAFGVARLEANGFAASRGPIAVAGDARLDRREELASELFPGAEAAGRTNAEILIATYERWGSGWHEHLHGALAAALWDGRERTLLLLRDRIGERGLYWSRSTRRLFFASEPILIAASGEVDRKPNRLRLLAYLLGARPDPAWSFFENIHRVPEGCQLHVGQENHALELYWSWDRSPADRLDHRTAEQELAARLHTAVSRRLPADGEAGVLLSGGLDSCSVAACAADLLGQQQRGLRAFTWKSQSGDGIDETPLSRLFIASRPNVTEHSVEADGLWPLSRFPQAYSDPNSPETNAYPDLLLETLGAARASGASVLMNGIGGDSMIGWSQPDLSLLMRGRLSVAVRRWRDAGSLRRVGLVRELRLTTRRRRLPSWLTPEGIEVAHDTGLDRPPVPLRALTSPRMFRAFLITGSSNSAALERYSRLSHRVGVRIEAPWCDSDLASLVLSLPDGAFSEAPLTKNILRMAMADLLPAEILSAEPEKRGLSNLKPLGLLNHASAQVETLLGQFHMRDLGIVDGTTILNRYRQKRQAGRTSPGLWEVLTAEAWYRTQQALC